MLGLIGKKIGMTQVFDAQGRLTPVTVIKIEDNVVVAQRTDAKNGYNAAVLGSIDKKKSTVTKPYAGQFKDICEPKQVVAEFRDYEKDVKVGEVLGVDVFKDATYVDVSGTSKGKGFAGAIRRYGFSGGRDTHGSKFHRDLGGTAMSSTPARTFKGHRMAGHMGVDAVTVQNLKVVRIDEDLQVLMVKGAIPGPAHSVVIVKKAIKK
ncbi:MAG: 50S ribosomal protein L3 [Sphaerochaeta sp.]|jgi:large subunit ribosomal protein L3|nr:50S ribosomal protein L3 [Sphaerochaeta sp.]MCH3920349.1 50S ribosomal protein L3 [Sphaerochaeta sp.]MCI2045065.1 50S ribosomal protein L3 [Sphaerochaeta sp.]MCI2076128.1 50S ribosomal protein L3 [Sphaerochaeta sp.]MCI2096833.1 50S ribosomal protein L3 [Sphaerochaeta sp.]